MPFFLTLTIIFTLASSAVIACPTSNEIEAMYCQADVVFRGQPTSGSSSLSFDENGNNVSNGRLTFNVEQFYKNNGQSSEVDVVRSYSDADPCEPSFLPESTGSYLVFASGTTFLRVPPCGYVLGEECIPDNLENTSC